MILEDVHMRLTRDVALAFARTGATSIIWRDRADSLPRSSSNTKQIDNLLRSVGAASAAAALRYSVAPSEAIAAVPRHMAPVDDGATVNVATK
jgi:hypothetical protein